MQGDLALVLHAHLPFVRHPEEEGNLPERWLFEAITESYIPLIQVFEGLAKDGVPFRITVSLSPTLITMLTDPLLQDRYQQHLERLLELCSRELERTRPLPDFHPLARMYKHQLETVFLTYHRYGGNPVEAFRRLQDGGHLEVITTAATHGYLPLLGIHRESVRAQVAVAVDLYRQHFGRPPAGFWLPECAYRPGDDEILGQYGISYFITETHGLLFATPRPRHGVYAPVRCPSGVAAFGRDPESSRQVWSSVEGYPGDYYYREYYRDIGWDLDLDYVRPYIGRDGQRLNTGFKYYRITGKTEAKQPYLPDVATEKAAVHASNFLFNREKQMEWLAGFMGRPPIVVAPYDAELFGHWWFEGPQWLNFLIRKIARDTRVFRLVTPSDYLALHPRLQSARPCQSSWGYQGYHEIWLNGSNDWIYRHLHKAAGRMIELATARAGEADPWLRRALNQMARELLLAQASDWAFIMKAGTLDNYARRRTVLHLGRFTRLYHQVAQGTVDREFLQQVESRDNLFPGIDYGIYASLQPAPALAAL